MVTINNRLKLSIQNKFKKYLTKIVKGREFKHCSNFKSKTGVKK